MAVAKKKIPMTKRYEIAISEREIRLVQMTADGKTREEMAEELEISKKTVDGIFSFMNRLFQAKSPAHLVAIFYRDNLID